MYTQVGTVVPEKIGCRAGSALHLGPGVSSVVPSHGGAQAFIPHA